MDILKLKNTLNCLAAMSSLDGAVLLLGVAFTWVLVASAVVVEAACLTRVLFRRRRLRLN